MHIFDRLGELFEDKEKEKPLNSSSSNSDDVPTISLVELNAQTLGNYFQTVEAYTIPSGIYNQY